MLSYKLTAEIIQELKQLNSRFAQIYAEVIGYELEAHDAMHRYARISNIGASTRIENALLTDSEIEWLDTILTADGKPTAFAANKHIIENKLSKDRERSIEEVAGCRDMLHIIYEQATMFSPLTEANIRALHNQLMRYYPQAKHHKGNYKKNPNSVIETNHKTNKTHVVFKTAEPGPITKVAMTELLAWYNEALLHEAWSIAVASEFTYRFLAIHAFQDGNGRLGRGLFSLSLLQCADEPIKYLIPYMAIDRQIERHKAEYYFVLNQCSNGTFRQDPRKYHIEYFLKFMLKVLNLALDDIHIYKQRFDALQTMAASTIQVLNCFKDQPELRLTTKIITELTNIPRRTVSQALTILVENQFIQRLGKGAGIRYQLVF